MTITEKIMLGLIIYGGAVFMVGMFMLYKIVKVMGEFKLARNLDDLKEHQKPDNKPLFNTPPSDEVMAMEERIENEKRIKILRKEGRKLDLEFKNGIMG